MNAAAVTATKEAIKIFKCYHGDSTTTIPQNLSQIECLSKICIMFVTVCQSYWATTCYNETNPMSFLNGFQNISEFSSPFYQSYSTCSYSGCNLNPLNPTNSFGTNTIQKQPKSFDNLLWPNMGKEKQSNKFQNKITLGFGNNFIFEFIGQTTNENSKEIWFEFSVYNHSMDFFKPYKLTINLLDSIVTASVSDIDTKVYGKMSLNQTFAPGQQIVVTLISKNKNNVSLSINGEKINYFLKNFDFIRSMKYGGNWFMKIAAIPTHDLYNLPMTIDYPDPEPSFNKIHCDEEFLKTFQPNLKLNYTTFESTRNSTVNQTIATINLAEILAPNEAIEFELRDSLCPKNGVVRFQCETFENSTGIFYNYNRWEWWTLPPAWRNDGNYVMNAKKCPRIIISMNSERWYLSCQNNNGTTLADTAGNKGKYNNLKYFVQGSKQNFNC